MNRILLVTAAAAAIGFSGAALADVAAGKAKFDDVCSECHEPEDHAGVAPAELKGKINDILAKKIKHKGKLKLTDAEVNDLVAYFGTVKPDPSKKSKRKDD
jgi:mono/diheme cytochrome c family protein